MAYLPIDRVKTTGLAAAQSVLDPGIAELDIKSAPDSSGRPVYFMSFIFDQDHDGAKNALLRTRLSQRIRDELIAAGDPHYPIIRLLNRADWERV